MILFWNENKELMLVDCMFKWISKIAALGKKIAWFGDFNFNVIRFVFEIFRIKRQLVRKQQKFNFWKIDSVEVKHALQFRNKVESQTELQEKSQMFVHF